MFDGTVSPLANVSTTVTDISLGIESLMFGYWLIGDRQRAVQWWAIAFLAVGIAALSGSVYHGFYRDISPLVESSLRRLTNVAVSLSSGAMVMGYMTRFFIGSSWLWGAIMVGLKFALFCHLSLTKPDAFIYPVLDYLSAMVLIGLMSGWDYGVERAASAAWIVSGIGASSIAALILAAKWTVHPVLSPDAIYHIVQMIALYFFFQGSRRLRDRKFLND